MKLLIEYSLLLLMLICCEISFAYSASIHQFTQNTRLNKRSGLTSYDYEDHRLSLIFYGEQITERANQHIANLKRQNNFESILLLEADLKSINHSLSALRNSSFIADTYLTEFRFSFDVTNLEQRLYNSGVGWDLANVENIAIERAIELEKQLITLIDQLKSDEHLSVARRVESIADLEHQIDEMTDLRTQLQNVTDNNNTLIAALVFRLWPIELQVENELSLFGIETVSAQEKHALLREMDNVYTKLESERRKLEANGNSTLAEALYGEMQTLAALNDAVRNSYYTLHIIFCELKFRLTEMRITELIKVLFDFEQ